MPIEFNEKNGTFVISTPQTSYISAILEDGILAHIHYGGKIARFDFAKDVFKYIPRGFAAEDIPGGSTETIPMEYPTFGCADLRRSALHAVYADSTRTTNLRYASHRIFKGKKPLAGLPSAYVESESEADTLEIDLESRNLRVTLVFCAYREMDVICRSVRIENISSEAAVLKNALSMAFDLPESNYDFVTLEGAWAKERHLSRGALAPNSEKSIGSCRGASSHQQNPFFALCSPDANEKAGEVYAFSFVYSGNFICGAQVDQFATTRAFMGINPFDFEYELKSGEVFQTPEVVCTYSANGFGQASRTLHKLCRTRICRGKWRDAPRPVLINNWEATYFDFDEDKIVEIAREAKQLGVELMVLDDGWFGKRDDDWTSLGDWEAHPRKLPGGVARLAERINALGMKFGLWFEPEMVSPESELYRTHPHWCLHDGDSPRVQTRHQLVLDLSRPEVCEYVYRSVANVLRSANIEYVKWDMNRSMSETSAVTAWRYMLGLYGVMEKLTSEFSNILFEGCSGGGGRFDLGMLYYMPQFWTSDNTDAAERMKIQYGTSFAYPASTMGAHVSAVPNHQVHRVTDISTRGAAAMCGRFGYELDLRLLSDEEKAIVRRQIELYHNIEHTVHHGEMYRLSSPFDSNVTAWEFVDERQAVLFVGNMLAEPNGRFWHIRLEGLEPDALYEAEGKTYRGDVLMNMGLIWEAKCDFYARIFTLRKI
ncbi:MAG: alpha-galactosidase [Clostridia bacterium]|nr:alpha-galactosidase [Clostridia bacterium]